VPLEVLLSVGRFDPAQLDDGGSQHNQHHSHAFRTWSYETREPLSLEALRETARRLPASIYRCKGGGSYRRRTGPSRHPSGCRQTRGYRSRG
jgi:hypothetical protein